MARYIGEEEVWKCPKHPSKRRRNGVCPTCLRDRLSILCPDCANIRPCACSPSATSSLPSSSSSSFSLFSSFSSSSRTTAPDDSSTVSRVGNLIESEPKFQKSRSVAIPFRRPRFSASGRENLFGNDSESDHKFKTRSFWSILKSSKHRKGGDLERMMLKSKSTRVESGGADMKASWKGKSWYFPSPIKVFRQRSKVVQDRSPLQR